MPGTVRVDGLRELTRDFKKISKDLDKEVTNELKEAADPVKRDAQQKGLSQIRNLTQRWSRMRIGVSKAKGLVYMVPATKRSVGTPRPNLNPLLMDEAMWPAVEDNRDEVVKGLEEMIDKLGGHYGLD